MGLEAGLGEALRTDYFLLREEFTPAQLDYLERTRRFVQEEVLPVINGYWERAEFPWPLIKKLGGAGLVGGIQGYGCPELDPLSAGLVTMELNRGDGSLGTFLGVQAGLAMRSIAMLGSEEQKQRWLPDMARLEKLGAFALTEPDHGSDSVALETTARRDAESYVIDGTKKWIGNGTAADVVVVWARHPAGLPRHQAHGRHRGHPHLRRHRHHPEPHRRPGHHRRIRVQRRRCVNHHDQPSP
jgi:glutaryl-CoA dehydrogenase